MQLLAPDLVADARELSAAVTASGLGLGWPSGFTAGAAIASGSS